MPLLFYFLAGKLFALIVGGYYFKCLTRPYRLVLYLIGIAAISESYGYYIMKHLHEHNIWLFNFYLVAEAWLMGMAAVQLLIVPWLKKVFLMLLVIGSIIWVLNVVRNSIYVFASLSMVYGLILLTVMYLAVLFTNSVFKNKNILVQPVFWLAISTILYCACDIPYMALHNYLITNAPVLSAKLISINDVLDIVRYPLVAISFILLGRQKQGVLNAAG